MAFEIAESNFLQTFCSIKNQFSLLIVVAGRASASLTCVILTWSN